MTPGISYIVFLYAECKSSKRAISLYVVGLPFRLISTHTNECFAVEEIGLSYRTSRWAQSHYYYHQDSKNSVFWCFLLNLLSTKRSLICLSFWHFLQAISTQHTIKIKYHSKLPFYIIKQPEREVRCTAMKNVQNHHCVERIHTNTL